MKDPMERPHFYTGKVYRAFSFLFGLFLAAIGCYGIFFAETSAIWRLVGGAIFVVLGYNMAYSAYKAKESWLSKIGPLP